ncbi:hypothetical protein IWW50_001259 [Coemansia erecta]|nr:hypothetical protein GGF43_003384 [Coemansia sp. RSA 2618]KAJ2828669.1 hypothetical protein IWW50_001259 [Coemansia erecta]
MTVFDLQLKADLENVTNLLPKEDIENDQAYNWFIKYECGSCHEATENLVTICRNEFSPISGSRGEANLVMSCKFCKREHSASISGPPQAYTKSGEYATITQIECRGMDPVAFEPRGEWTASGSESDARFTFSLDENEWYDYDDDAGETVSVSNIEAQFVRGRQQK